MEDDLSIHEKYVEKPYVIRLYEQALEQGREQGIEQGMKKLLRTYMQKHPNLSIEKVATLYDVDVRLVKEVADVIKQIPPVIITTISSNE